MMSLFLYKIFHSHLVTINILTIALILNGQQAFCLKAKSSLSSSRQTKITTLTQLNIYRNLITASGHSSGASFVHNLHLAHSQIFYGIGIFSGLYYQFGGVYSKNKRNSSSVMQVKNEHKGEDPPGVRVQASIKALYKYNRVELIDPLKNLKFKHVFIYAGSADELHPIEQRGYGIRDIYKRFVHDRFQQINLILKYAPHKPPIGICTADDIALGYDCSYNGVIDMFQFLLQWRFGLPKRATHKLQPLVKFDQTEFLQGFKPNAASLANYGYIYIPDVCKRKKVKCLLHIFFHGCHGKQKEAVVSNDIYQLFGDFAETNQMIILFPFQRSSKINRAACWDFTGYSGSKYATKEGVQIQIVYRMISRILGK